MQALKRKYSLDSSSAALLKGIQAYSRLPLPQPFSKLQTSSHKLDRFFLHNPLTSPTCFNFQFREYFVTDNDTHIIPGYGIKVFQDMELKTQIDFITQLELLDII